MKKTIISLIIGVCTICAYSYDFKINGIYYSIVKKVSEEKVCEVVVAPKYQWMYDGYKPTETYIYDMVIPKYFEYGGYKCTVVGVDCNAFRYCDLSSIEFPEGTKFIGDYAFAHAKYLRYVVIPKDVTTIGTSVFSYAKNLSSVELHEGITEIGGGAFAHTEKLTSIDIPSTVKEIKDGAFMNSAIHKLVIPKSVENIGLRAFTECFQMSALIFEDSEIPLQTSSIDYSEVGTKPRHDGYLYLGRYYEDYENFQSFRNSVGIFLESQLTNESFLKTVEIGPYVKIIPSRTFANDLGLKVINCYNPVPPKYENAPKSFPCYTDDVRFPEVVYENAVLYVPEGSLEAYKAHEVWGKFKNIVEGNITIGINEIAQADNHPKVYTKGMAIMVEGSNDAESVSVYSIDGRLVYAGKSDCIELQTTGIYIVRIGNYTTKVIL